MPLPSPAFNNAIDPLLPTDIKPHLYYYDEYQTYDLVSIELMCRDVSDLLAGLSSNLGFVNHPFLVERFTPYKYEWCNEYSLTLYNRLKKYSGTIFHNTYFLGAKAFTENAYFLANPSPFPLSGYIKNNSNSFIELKIPATEKSELIILTWLSIEQETIIYGSVPLITLNKQQRIIHTHDTETIIKINLAAVADFSLVISGFASGELENQFNTKSKFYLFKNVDEFFIAFDNHIKSTFPLLKKVLKYLLLNQPSSVESYKNTYTLKNDPNTAYNLLINGVISSYDDYNSGSYVYIDAGFLYQYKVPTIDNFIDLPEWFSFHSLTFASNNYWNDNIIPIPDIATGEWYYFSHNFPPCQFPPINKTIDDISIPGGGYNRPPLDPYRSPFGFSGTYSRLPKDIKGKFLNEFMKYLGELNPEEFATIETFNRPHYFNQTSYYAPFMGAMDYDADLSYINISFDNTPRVGINHFSKALVKHNLELFISHIGYFIYRRGDKALAKLRVAVAKVKEYNVNEPIEFFTLFDETQSTRNGSRLTINMAEEDIDTTSNITFYNSSSEWELISITPYNEITKLCRLSAIDFLRYIDEHYLYLNNA